MNFAPINGEAINGTARSFVLAAARINGWASLTVSPGLLTEADVVFYAGTTLSAAPIALRQASSALGGASQIAANATPVRMVPVFAGAGLALNVDSGRHIGGVANIRAGGAMTASAHRSAYVGAQIAASASLQARATNVHGARATVWAVAEMLASVTAVAGAATCIQPTGALSAEPFATRGVIANINGFLLLSPEAQSNPFSLDIGGFNFTRPAQTTDFTRPAAVTEFMRQA